MPFQPIGDRPALGVNMENADAYRQKRRDDLATGRRPPGGAQLGGAWDAFYGGLMRQDEDAADAGMRSRVDLSGIGTTASPGIGTMPTAFGSLQRRARGPADEGDTFDPTEYQIGRAYLDRQLHDNAARATAQNYATTDLQRAHDPGVVDYEEQEARRKAAEDQQAKDEIEAASFRRLEPTRRLELREKVGSSREMLPFNPAVIQSQYKASAAFDANQAKRDAETIRAEGRTSAAGIAAAARVASSLGLDPALPPEEVLRHADQALGQLGYPPPAPVQPGVPAAPLTPSPVRSLNNAAGAGPTGALKPFPEASFPKLMQDFGGDAGKANDWLRLHGYVRSGGG